jgi:glycosyltransferase involved in cell wall biosynthesis
MPWLLTSSSHRYYGAIKRAVHEADAVIAVSEATARDLVELVGAAREKVHVVYEAADQGMAPIARDDAARQVLSRFGVSDPFVLFVGTIEPRKNLLTLVRAIGLLRREIPIRLVVAGPRGWLSEPAFSTLRREADADGVIFLGAVPPSDLQPLYCAAEALALPSLYEGFGLAPLEAMACGTPVVVSNAGSLPEIVGDAGVLIAAEDAEDVANALAWVIGNASYRASLVERGLARAAMFSWDRAARETLAVYERVAAA